MHSKKKILKKMREKMRGRAPGDCYGCPLLIYFNTYYGMGLQDIDCLSDCERLFKILNIKFRRWRGCAWLHNYILNVSPRETIRI